MWDVINTIMSVLCVLCIIAIPVLLIIFVIRWIMRKKKKWIGLAAAFCGVGIIITALIGSMADFYAMTPEEREAYYAQLEQEKEANEKPETTTSESQGSEEKETNNSSKETPSKTETTSKDKNSSKKESSSSSSKKQTSSTSSKQETHSHKYIEVEYTPNFSQKKATVKKECSCGKTKTEKVSMSTDDISTYLKKNCKAYSYEDVARYPDKHKGELAVFKGEVVQVQELLGTTTLLVFVTDEEGIYYKDSIYVKYEFTDELKILKGDIITMYGEMLGEETYYSVLGQLITVPSMKAYYAELNE